MLQYRLVEDRQKFMAMWHKHTSEYFEGDFGRGAVLGGTSYSSSYIISGDFFNHYSINNYVKEIYTCGTYGKA